MTPDSSISIRHELGVHLSRVSIACGLEPIIGEMIAGAGWGRHIETALKWIVGRTDSCFDKINFEIGSSEEVEPAATEDMLKTHQLE